MEFIWQPPLYSLLLIPFLIVGYLRAQRRRKDALLIWNPALAEKSVLRDSGWRRHIPPAFFFFAIVIMLVALARPVSVVKLPSTESIVILAIDVSVSMRAEDVKPSRIDAAKSAAIAFVEKQEAYVKIGVVAFSGNAAIVQTPTNDHDSAIKAIKRLSLGPSTAIGTAILVSLDAIAESLSGESSPLSQTLSRSSLKFTQTQSSVSREAHAPAIILLLTDGQNNSGPSPLEIAPRAAEHGVRVYTIGIGTREEATAQAPNRFAFPTSLDEKTLKEIASETGAQYYYAKNENDLHSIYENFNSLTILRTQRIEVTALFTAAAAILSLLGGALSLLWFNRLP